MIVFSQLGAFVLPVMLAWGIWWFAGTHGISFLAAGRRSSGGSHARSPDLALVQPFALRRAAALALFGCLLLAVLLQLFLLQVARSDFRHSLWIVPTVVENAHLEGYSPCSDDDGSSPGRGATLLDGLEKMRTGGKDGVAAIFLQELTGEKDLVAFSGADALVRIQNYISAECAPGGRAPEAFAGYLIAIGLPEDVDYEGHLLKSLLPSNLAAVEAQVFFTTLPQPETAGASGGADGIQSFLQQHFDNHPADEILLYALYEGMREKLHGHRRMRVFLLGPIQGLTFGLFFFALILLRGRLRVLEEQRSSGHNLRRHLGDRVRTTSGGGSSAAPWVDVLPRTSMDGGTWPLLAKGVASFSSRTPIFLAGVLCGVLEELLAHDNITEARDQARGLLRQTIERSESLLDRVEYAAIHFAAYAMPTLGFIGTVLGIGQALGSADEVVRAGDALQQANAITAVTSVLGLAFDTTLVALACSLPATWLVSRIHSQESRFLLAVEQAIADRLLRPEDPSTSETAR